ncbi:hypothetical protein AU106_gp088 [Sinorhizobium phage phiM9]|uniref:Uncharacterized protein n=1 Tax=Sinorhizobium phage phiM9 TaxID=1636182 RepID=A0A0F6THH5_9CAUD|nr:hypothetical protein AU106_gp088 [Sinorhizobium phage phiM9]AKE44719.1 hypothetical protein Sm_phiM9_090 [Sinorhizobium phage phiM9]
MNIGECVEVRDVPIRHQFDVNRRYVYGPRALRYRDRPSDAIGRVWRLSKNTYRFEIYRSSVRYKFRNASYKDVCGKATTFSSALSELIRRYRG